MVVKVVLGKDKGGGYEISEKRYIQKRELDILAMYANGISLEKIGKRLGIRPQTVKNHLFNIGKKLAARSRTNAVVKAIEKGMLELVTLDREEAFEKESRPEYIWCLHCERTYLYDESRVVKIEPFTVDHVKYEPVFQMCPYEDCDGDAVLDAWDWNYVREHHPDYPEIPEHGVVYPMYGEKK